MVVVGPGLGIIFNALTLFFCDWHNAILLCNLFLGVTTYSCIFSVYLNVALINLLLVRLFSQMIERGHILTFGSACFNSGIFSLQVH